MMGTLLVDDAVNYLLSLVTDQDSTPVAVYAQLAPEDHDSPVIVFTRVSGRKPAKNLQNRGSLGQTTFQIDVYHVSYAACKYIADQVRQVLDGYRGTVTIGLNSIRIGGVSFQAERDFIESQLKPVLYRSSVDYLFTYSEE